jgi:hypothetical protein
MKKFVGAVEFGELRELILIDLIKNRELYLGRTLNLAEMEVLHQSADILFAKIMREHRENIEKQKAAFQEQTRRIKANMEEVK